MKKINRLLLLLLVVILLVVPSSCGFVTTREPKEESKGPVQTAEPTPEPTKKPTPTPHPRPTPAPKILNLLTGEPTLTQEAVGKRPVAVTIDNLTEALPQEGIGSADVLFELPVEGDITRLMAVYGDYTKVPEICPIRSCRYYYPILAAGFHAVYVHWGQDELLATETLNLLTVDTLDGLKNTGGLFSRSQTRLDGGYSYEHTGCFDGAGLPKTLQQMGVSAELPVNKNDPFFLFRAEAEAPEGQACKTATIGFGGETFSTLVYNSYNQTYDKYHCGSPHRDGVTGIRLTYSNVFVLETEIETLPEKGLKKINWKGGADHFGYYISCGAAQKITWQKKDEYANLEFFTLDGKRLRVNPGKSYIAFTSSGNTALSAS